MEKTGRQKTTGSRQSPTHNNNNNTSPTTNATGNKKSLESFVGKSIKLKTASNEEVEGLIYTYDKITNCIVIDISSHRIGGDSRKKCSFRILKISHIKEIISVGSSGKDYLAVGPVQVDRLKSRESEALKGFVHQVSKIGVGVTKEAQDIFNALSKTLPCRWSKDTIVVMDEVLITPPYSVENCKANPTSAASLARVKKVLEGERRRLLK